MARNSELFFGRLIASGTAVNQHQNKQTIRPRWVQQIIKREKGGENEKKAVIPSEVAQEFSLLFSWTFPLCKSGLMRTKSFLSRVEDIKFKKEEEGCCWQKYKKKIILARLIPSS